MPFYPPSGGIDAAAVQVLINASLTTYSTTAQMNTAIAAALVAYPTTVAMNAAIAAAGPVNVLDTQGSDATTFALTNLAPNGNLDGDYSLIGQIDVSAGGVLTLTPNGVASNQRIAAIFNNVNASTVAGERRSDLLLGGAAAAGSIVFKAYLSSKTGRWRLWFAQSETLDGGTPTNDLQEVITGAWEETVTNITGLTFAFSGGNILTGSYCRSTKLKNTT